MVCYYLLVIVVAISQWRRVESRVASPADLTTVDNGFVTVGVDSNRGGSITYFSREWEHCAPSMDDFSVSISPNF